MEETEQLARENLKQALKFQKAYYDTKCHGQRFRVGNRVWHKNQARTRRRKFLKLWCGHWRVVKALSDVTYRTEKERRKPGKRRPRKVVHLNYLKPCFTSTETQEKPSRAATSTRVEETPPVETLRDVRISAHSGDVEVEWLENPASTGTKLSHPSQDRIKLVSSTG